MTRQLAFDFESPTPDYFLRVSPRAKRPRIEVSLHGQIRVIIPRRFNADRVPAFVAEHRAWIDRNLRQVEKRRADNPAVYDAKPHAISLQAVGKTWLVNYSEHATVTCGEQRNEEGRAMLCITSPSCAAPHNVLQEWLHTTAIAHLLPWLQNVSAETGLTYTRATIRNQKTRWGSCSQQRCISLNRNILFLPPHLVRYLFVHELCHTVHMNHSRRYWALVAQHEPGYRLCEKQLQKAQHLIPVWAFPH